MRRQRPSPLPPSQPIALSADPAPGARPRVLSEADCEALGARLARVAMGGGETLASITSTWRGNVRWARNRVSTSGEDVNHEVAVGRTFGRENDTLVRFNEDTDAALLATVRRAEQLVQLRHEPPPRRNRLTAYLPESFTPPALFSDATYQLDAAHWAATAHELAQPAEAAGLLSAGYLEVSAHTLARVTSWGITRYVQYTWAQLSVTVRDPHGTGSGWAGVDCSDWRHIDAPALAALALDKCLRSRNPVAIEPGRYTTILEPQAVCDFVGQLVYGGWSPIPAYQMLDLAYNTTAAEAPFNQRPGVSKLGEPVVDTRITISADPLDPEMGFPPLELWPPKYGGGILDDVYHPATWIERGVLTHLAYGRGYVTRHDAPKAGLPNAGAFRMSGGDTSLAEMIATTARGLLVTRFDRILPLDIKSLVLRGYTRDGVWLIEHGQLSKPVRNMVCTESILAALNNVEQLGVPQRTFHPADPVFWALPQPVLVPPLKIRDFTFTGVTHAV